MEDSIDFLKKLQEDNMKLLQELLSCREDVKNAVEGCRKMKWIKVSERLPESGERVLFTTGSFVGEAYWDGKRNWVRYPALGQVEQFLGVVTHWMPMPKYEEDVK